MHISLYFSFFLFYLIMFTLNHTSYMHILNQLVEIYKIIPKNPIFELSRFFLDFRFLSVSPSYLIPIGPKNYKALFPTMIYILAKNQTKFIYKICKYRARNIRTHTHIQMTRPQMDGNPPKKEIVYCRDSDPTSLSPS